MISRKDLQVCILFHNKVEQTIEAIKSINDSHVSILVLNNNSSKRQLQTLKEYSLNKPEIKIYNSDSNLGVSRGRNFLIEKSKAPWILFIDNDITVKTIRWFDIIQKEIQNDPTIEVFIPILFNKHENRYSRPVKFDIKDNELIYRTIQSKYTNNFPGGASFISKKFFNRIGKYNEDMFVGFEDFEMALRSLFNGVPIKAKLINSIELIHDHRHSVDKDTKESVKIRYDYKEILNSHRIITDLYGVNIDSNFKPWLEEQKRQMNGESKLKTISRKIKNKISFFTKRILKPINRKP